MDFIAGIISSISGYMYSYILIILLIAAGIYFSFRTKFVQIRLLKESIRVIAEPKKDKDSISSFQALMVSTASRVGTGNIVGVTGAIIRYTRSEGQTGPTAAPPTTSSRL